MSNSHENPKQDNVSEHSKDAHIAPTEAEKDPQIRELLDIAAQRGWTIILVPPEARKQITIYPPASERPGEEGEPDEV